MSSRIVLSFGVVVIIGAACSRQPPSPFPAAFAALRLGDSLETTVRKLREVEGVSPEALELDIHLAGTSDHLRSPLPIDAARLEEHVSRQVAEANRVLGASSSKAGDSIDNGARVGVNLSDVAGFGEVSLSFKRGRLSFARFLLLGPTQDQFSSLVAQADTKFSGRRVVRKKHPTQNRTTWKVCEESLQYELVRWDGIGAPGSLLGPRVELFVFHAEKDELMECAEMPKL